MKTNAVGLAILAIGVASPCFSQEAHALGPVDLEVAGKVGGGTNPLGGRSPSPLGLGFGARTGVSFKGVYGGLQFMYYLGGTLTQPGSGDVGFSISESAVLFGIEVGYGATLHNVTLRAQVGLGNFQLTERCVFSGSINTGHPYAEPGGVILVPIGRFFVGFDANLLVVPDVEVSPSLEGSGPPLLRFAFTGGAQGGVRF